MSFTRILQGKQRVLKPRCHRCGKTKRVFPVTIDGGHSVIDLCADCRKEQVQR